MTAGIFRLRIPRIVSVTMAVYRSIDHNSNDGKRRTYQLRITCARLLLAKFSISVSLDSDVDVGPRALTWHTYNGAAPERPSE
jgi:hypothetical protein